MWLCWRAAHGFKSDQIGKIQFTRLSCFVINFSYNIDRYFIVCLFDSAFVCEYMCFHLFVCVFVIWHLISVEYELCVWYSNNFHDFSILQIFRYFVIDFAFLGCFPFCYFDFVIICNNYYNYLRFFCVLCVLVVVVIIRKKMNYPVKYRHLFQFQFFFSFFCMLYRLMFQYIFYRHCLKRFVSFCNFFFVCFVFSNFNFLCNSFI